MNNSIPDSKDHGANMGPIWVLSAPGEPHVGPMNLAIRCTWCGDTTGYLVVKGMFTSFVIVCVRKYTIRPFCFYRSNFAHYMTYPLAQIFQLTQFHSLGEGFTLLPVNSSSYPVSLICSLSHTHMLQIKSAIVEDHVIRVDIMCGLWHPSGYSWNT